jgi:Uma2 family endonuclease
LGSPDMIIEVLSPSTSQLDFEEKKLVYERFGVQEYFIIDPASKMVYTFFLNKNSYEEQEIIEGTIKSALLNTQITF